MRQRHNTLHSQQSTSEGGLQGASAYDASPARSSVNPAMYIHQRWGTWKPLAAILVALALLNLLVARSLVSPHAMSTSYNLLSKFADTIYLAAWLHERATASAHPGVKQ